MLTRTVLVLLGVLASLVAPVPAAHAQARVSISSDRGGAVVDPTYATTLEVGGTGFQSVRGGHGGIYVFFGTVSGNWRPSKGGVTGEDYFYVPDSESQANAGHQKYVAFPGSDTAASANGGTVSAAGRWSTTITVPGATFQAVDRDGGTRTVDCRKVRCGIITVGAHGVTNAANETFTPVTVKDLYGGKAPDPAGSPAAGAPAAEEAAAPEVVVPDVPAAPQAAAAPVLSVDRASAVAGRALSFTARGLTPGAQVSAVLDDGVAAAGPFLVGTQGQVTGVLTLPVAASGGTHELRLYGLDGDQPPVVRFAIAAGDEPVAATVAPADHGRATDRWGIGFFVAAGVVLAGALARLVLARRRGVSGA